MPAVMKVVPYHGQRQRAAVRGDDRRCLAQDHEPGGCRHGRRPARGARPSSATSPSIGRGIVGITVRGRLLGRDLSGARGLDIVGRYRTFDPGALGTARCCSGRVPPADSPRGERRPAGDAGAHRQPRGTLLGQTRPGERPPRPRRTSRRRQTSWPGAERRADTTGVSARAASSASSHDVVGFSMTSPAIPAPRPSREGRRATPISSIRAQRSPASVFSHPGSREVAERTMAHPFGRAPPRPLSGVGRPRRR
jgi:hypothetical protein